MKKKLLLAACSLLAILVYSQDQYSYTAPQDWLGEKGNEYVRYVQPSTTGQACVLTIITPQVSSGDLEADVKNVFNQMYAGWNFYYSDARRDELMKGTTSQGLAYCMMEGAMVRDRAEGGWDYETGAALVIGVGKKIAIVALRHESTGLYCKCKHRYDYWGRFFRSFTVKEFSAKPVLKEDSRKRFIGSWMVSGGKVIGEYIFAANGHYQYIGGYGSMNRVSRDMIEIRTSAFKGDGKYEIRDSSLSLIKKGYDPQPYLFRFEKVNKGSTGWVDRLYLVNEHPADGGKPYEVCYEKKPGK